MYRRQKHGKQRRIGRVSNRETRENQGVHGKECQISDDAPGCGAVRKLGGASVPQAEALEEYDERSRKAGDDIEFYGTHQRDCRREDEQGKRSAKKTLGGQSRLNWSCDSRGHGGIFIVS